MEVAINEIIDMIPMRNSCMSTVSAVFVCTVMAFALVLGCAGGRVGRRLRQFALVYVIAVYVMEVTIVYIVNVIFVLDG